MFLKNNNSAKIFSISLILLLIYIKNNDCTAIDDKLKEFIEDFKKRMCRPIPSLNIPTLDPFENDEFNFNVTEKRLGHVEGVLWRLKVANLSNLVVNKISISFFTFKFEANFTLPIFEIASAYKLKGIISDIFPLEGASMFKIQIHNATIVMKGKLLFLDDGISIANFNIDPSVSKFSGSIGDITPSKEINEVFDNIINEKGPEIVSTFWYDYKNLTENSITDLVKELTKGLNSSTIIDIITSNEPIYKPTDPPPTCKNGDKSVSAFSSTLSLKPETVKKDLNYYINNYLPSVFGIKHNN